MQYHMTFEQFVFVLEHNRDNTHGADVVLLQENGDLTIEADQPTGELLDVTTWPRYVCRVSAITDHVDSDTRAAAKSHTSDAAVDGLFSAYDHINWALSRTPLPKPDLRQLVAQAGRTAFTAVRGAISGR